MNTVSPNICLGALDAINFLIETYGTNITNEYNLRQLYQAKKKFEELYETSKHIKENEEIALKSRQYSKKNIMITYGKLFVSKEIETDPIFIEELNNKYPILTNNVDERNLEYNIGYIFGLKSSIHQLKKIVTKINNNDKQSACHLAIEEIENFCKEIMNEIVKTKLSKQDLKEIANSYNGLLGMLDAYTFCNDNYSELISIDFGVAKINEKISNFNYCL